MNELLERLGKIAVCTAIAASLLTLSQVALAQAKPALVRDVDAPSRQPYQESKAATCAVPHCLFALSTVPSGTRRVIQNVSCIIPVFISKITWAELVNDIALVTQFIVPTPIYDNPAFPPPLLDGGIFNTATLMFFEAGQVPKIGFQTIAPFQPAFTCMVSGYDVTLP